jgi:hypothetical protein
MLQGEKVGEDLLVYSKKLCYCHFHEKLKTVEHQALEGCHPDTVNS